MVEIGSAQEAPGAQWYDQRPRRADWRRVVEEDVRKVFGALNKKDLFIFSKKDYPAVAQALGELDSAIESCLMTQTTTTPPATTLPSRSIAVLHIGQGREAAMISASHSAHTAR